MGKLRSSSQLQAIFQEIKEKQQRRKEAQERKEKKEQEKLSKEQEKASRKLEKHFYEQQRTIIIYNTRYVQRFTDDFETYNTRQELKDAEKRGEGAIHWDVWNKLVDETKKCIEESLKH